MKNKLLLPLCIALTVPSTIASAGGSLSEFKITGEVNVPGFTRVETVDQFLDVRCASVEFTLDTTVLPNEGRNDTNIDIETTRAIFQKAADKWNDIPTSYIELNVTSAEKLNNGARRFDFINEINFEAPNIGGGESVRVALQQDTMFNVGDDIDNDGDSDVFDPQAVGRNTCGDIDNDGDIEFPAGLYLAGTILDSDIQYTNKNQGWSTSPNSGNTLDLQAIATHEFGHAHGLAHSSINQISSNNADSSTMYPFLDINDIAAQFDVRKLHEDDIAWSSFKYPEGSQPSGIAALQPGDIPFDQAYVVIEGEVKRNGLGVLGATVYAERIDFMTGNVLRHVDAYTGNANFVRRESDGNILFPAPNDILYGVRDGRYELPLRRGTYQFGVKALDGSPIGAANVGIIPRVGQMFGQLNFFPEEYASFFHEESNSENQPGNGRFISVYGYYNNDVNFIVNENNYLSSFANIPFGFANIANFQDNVVYAVRFSSEDVLARLDAGLTLTTALLRTNVFDDSIVPLLDEVVLGLGTVSEDGETLELSDIIFQSAQPFIGVDGEDSPFYLKNSENLSSWVSAALRDNPDMDLFLTAEVTRGLNPGPNGQGTLIGVDAGPNRTYGNSFISINGSPLNVSNDVNFGMQLLFNLPQNN